MKSIFLDTVGLLALWDSSDQWHEAALRALDELGPHVVTLTTSFVMLECGNAAARRSYRSLVDQTRRKLQAGNKLIVPEKV
jgi:predicted nucleic acid-binding protein